MAAECVVLAETKDHLNWELIGELAKKAKGEKGSALKEAHKEVEDEEDEHLYHTTGWTPRAVDRDPGHAGRPAAARGGEGREDGDRRRPGEAGAQGHAVGPTMAQKRTTLRSRAGAKLYVKRSKTGQFTDIQSTSAPTVATSSGAPRPRVRGGLEITRGRLRGPRVG